MPIPAIPVWGWAAGGAAALFLAMKMKSKKTTATGQAQTAVPRSGNNGNAPSPSIFFLPQGVQNPNQITVNVPRYPDPAPAPAVPIPGSGGMRGGDGGHPPHGDPPPQNFGPFPVPQPAPPSLGYAPPSAGYVPPPPPPPPGPRARVRVSPWPGNASNGLAGWDTTLWGIANHFQTSVASLVAANHISNPNLIHPGQEIVVP